MQVAKPKKKRKPGRIFLGAILFLAVAALCLYFAKDALLRQVYPLAYYETVMEQSKKNELDPALVYGVIRAESSFDPNAVSSADARGLMQLTPETFEWVRSMTHDGENITEADITDPDINIRFGCELLALLLSHYGNEETALCAYNAGMGNVSSWLENSEYSSDGVTLQVIPFGETEKYLEKVLSNREMYRSLYSEELTVT